MNKETIDNHTFKMIWDTFARLMNSGEINSLLDFRNDMAWNCLRGIGAKLFSLLTIRNLDIACLDSNVRSNLENEIVYAVQTGYTIRLVEELITQGNIFETTKNNIEQNNFIEHVFRYNDYFNPSMLEVSLCEFQSQIATHVLFEEVKNLTDEIISIMKDEILSANLYGCAAAVIEES